MEIFNIKETNNSTTKWVQSNLETSTLQNEIRPEMATAPSIIAGQRRFRKETNPIAVKLLCQAQTNDADEIAALILKYTKANGASPTYNAAEAADLEAVKKLLKHGGNPKEAFHGSLRGKSITTLKYLIEDQKVSLSSMNSDRWDIYWGSEWWEGLDYLLSKGVKIPNLDYFFSTHDQTTPNVLTGLIKRGAKFSSEFTTVYWITMNGLFMSTSSELKIRIFQSLTKDCNFPINGTFGLYNKKLNKVDNYTPITFAVANNDINLARALLELGADPNLGAELSQGGRGDKPMWYATKLTKNQEMIALLIRYGARVDNV